MERLGCFRLCGHVKESEMVMGWKNKKTLEKEENCVYGELFHASFADS